MVKKINNIIILFLLFCLNIAYARLPVCIINGKYVSYPKADIEIAGANIISCINGEFINNNIVIKGGSSKDVILIKNVAAIDNLIIYGDKYNNLIDNKVDADFISIKYSKVNSIYGDYFENNNNKTAANDSIAIINSKVKNGVYGDYFYHVNNSVAGKDSINIKDNSIIRDLAIAGDYFSNSSNGKAGDDIINIENNSSAEIINGDYFYRSNNSIASNDKITIKNSIVNIGILGDFFSSSAKGKAGDDIITVEDKSRVLLISGDLFDNARESQSGNDIINVDNSMVKNIYGEFAGSSSSVSKSGDDIVNIKDATSVSGDIKLDANPTVITDKVKGGSDMLNIYGYDITIEGIIDGGDDTSIADGAIDNLNYVDYVGNGVDESKVKNFENFNLTGRTKVIFAPNYRSANYLKYTIDDASSAVYTGKSIINADVDNKGIIDLASNKSTGDILIIKERKPVKKDDGVNGNLNSNDGVIKLDVDFVNSTADKVIVNGKIMGKGGFIAINYINSEIIADINDISLIIVKNDSNKENYDFNFVDNQRYKGNNKQLFLPNGSIWQLKKVKKGRGHAWVLNHVKQ